MIGVILLVFASVFAQFPFASSAPDVTDYDLKDEKEANDYKEAVDSYEGQISLFGAMSSVSTNRCPLFVGLRSSFVRVRKKTPNIRRFRSRCFSKEAMIPITSIVGRQFLVVLEPFSASFPLGFAFLWPPMNRWGMRSNRGTGRDSTPCRRR